MSEITDFYRRPGLTSDLGRHQDFVPGLPTGPEALGAIVRGLLIHNFAAKAGAWRGTLLARTPDAHSARATSM